MIEVKESLTELKRLESQGAPVIAKKMQMLKELKNNPNANACQLSRKLGFSAAAVGRWMQKYQSEGFNGLICNKSTSKEWESLQTHFFEIKTYLRKACYKLKDYNQLRSYIETKFGFSVPKRMMYNFVRSRFGNKVVFSTSHSNQPMFSEDEKKMLKSWIKRRKNKPTMKEVYNYAEKKTGKELNFGSVKNFIQRNGYLK